MWGIINPFIRRHIGTKLWKMFSPACWSSWDYDMWCGHMWTNSEFPKGSTQKGGLKTCHVCTKPANLFSSKDAEGRSLRGKAILPIRIFSDMAVRPQAVEDGPCCIAFPNPTSWEIYRNIISSKRGERFATGLNATIYRKHAHENMVIIPCPNSAGTRKGAKGSRKRG